METNAEKILSDDITEDNDVLDVIDLMLKLDDLHRSLQTAQVQILPIRSEPYVITQRLPRKYYRATESS